MAERDAHASAILVVGLFGILTVSSGLGFYNLSLYMNVLANARGFSVTALSGATSTFFLAGGVAGLVVGQLLQRFDARWIILGGALLGGTAIALIGFARTSAELFALYGVFGVSNSAVGLLPATTLVARRFPSERRAAALSITSTGLSLGGVLLTPLSAALFERMGAEFTMPVLGGLYVAGISPLALWAVRSSPGDAATRGRGPVELPGTPFRHAVATRFFVVLTMAYMALMAGQVGGIAHLYSRGTEIASALDAAFAVSTLAVLSITGRLLGGWMLSRVPIRAFALVNVAGQAVGLGMLAWADRTHQLWLATAVFGFTVGNLLMLQPLILGQAFGLRDYARIFSLGQALSTLGVASGPFIIGVIRSVSSYEAAFAAMAAASVVAFALIVAAGPLPTAGASPPGYAPGTPS